MIPIQSHIKLNLCKFTPTEMFIWNEGVANFLLYEQSTHNKISIKSWLSRPQCYISCFCFDAYEKKRAFHIFDHKSCSVQILHPFLHIYLSN